MTAELNKKYLSSTGITQEVIDAINAAVEDEIIQIVPIGDPDYKNAVADRTFKTRIITGRGMHFVLIMSNPRFPSMMSRTVERLQTAYSILDSRSRGALEIPSCYGSSEGISYALWPYRTPLSQNRPLQFAQKYLLLPKIVRWLESVAQSTMKNSLEPKHVQAEFIQPLHSLRALNNLPSPLTYCVDSALHQISSGTFRPTTVLQHGDLWLGNVLLKNSRDFINPMGDGFTIIDWAGAKVAGYPHFDLIRFLMSCNVPGLMAAHYMNSMNKIVGCSPLDAFTSIMCSLAKLQQELENFPPARFIALCQSSIAFLRRADFPTPCTV